MTATAKAQTKTTQVGALKGLAQDFWADGPAPVFWVSFKQKLKDRFASKQGQKPGPRRSTTNVEVAKKIELWVATRTGVTEVLWGEGYHLPGEELFLETLLNPLGLKKKKNVLDLGAGIGSMGRYLAEKKKLYVTGFEVDRERVARAMHMAAERELALIAPVKLFDPATFQANMRYQAVVAREFFFAQPNRDDLLTEAVLSLINTPEDKGQITFIDYVLEPADREKPAIQAWLAFEKGANPGTEDEMRSVLANASLTVRMSEDLTEAYRTEILKGFARLAAYLATHPPAPETKRFVLELMELWGMRFSALRSGLRVVRFHGLVP